MPGSSQFEVIIIGGSYAGLSAAMALGRSLRKVLVIDSGEPCNRQTPHSHNFLTQDGKTPKEIWTLARQQVQQYSTIRFYEGIAVSGKKAGDGFEISTQAGETFTCRKLVLATGIKDLMPDIPGFAACWGISIIHCPYCHGYEFRGKETAILANGEKAIHLAGLVNNLTKKLTILTNGTTSLTTEQSHKLQKHNIRVIETEITGIENENGYIRNVLFKDETKKSLDALYASIPFVQHAEIPFQLGCEVTETGHLKVDSFYKTTVPGVFACGDNSSMMRSVANAVAGGNFAGALVNKELTDESF